jgi:hypothetical protein
MAAMAVTGLLIDAAWKSVFVSTAPPLLGVGNAVALRPVNLKVLDHRKAHTWHMQPLHQLLHAQPIEALPMPSAAAARLATMPTPVDASNNPMTSWRVVD